MNTVASVAKNRCVRLQQELVEMLRATGSIEGGWRRLNFNKPFGKKLACYGFAKRERQLLINKVAFPDLNFIEVDAALKAGNGQVVPLTPELRVHFEHSEGEMPQKILCRQISHLARRVTRANRPTAQP